MYLVMTCLEVRPALLGKAQKDYINAKGNETGDSQLLEVNELALIRGRFALPWSSRLLEGVGPGGFCTLMAQESWRRYRSHSIFGLEPTSAWYWETPLKMTYYSKLLFTPYTVFETSNRWSGGLVRILDKSRINVLVVVIVIVFIFRLLCFGFYF